MEIASNWTEQGYTHYLGFVQCKATTSKSNITSADFTAQKKVFLDQLVTVIQIEEIPATLILNWDVPLPPSTMDKKGVKRVEIVGQSGNGGTE